MLVWLIPFGSLMPLWRCVRLSAKFEDLSRIVRAFWTKETKKSRFLENG